MSQSCLHLRDGVVSAGELLAMLITQPCNHFLSLVAFETATRLSRKKLMKVKNIIFKSNN